jgi:serine/threonine protein kinase
MDKNLIEQQGFTLIEQIDDTIHTEVWKATQRELDRVVCLQILKLEAAQNPVELEHFLMIARIFAKVKSDAVAAVFDIVSTPTVHYVVMEFVDGPTVGSLVTNGRHLSEEHILQIGASLAHCLEQLWHKDQLIHRNLKGDTVLIDQRGVAKLTDFSLAIKANQDLTTLDGGNIVGTPSFIAPEYAKGVKNLTTQADMYSFGALMYQLATGHAPFSTLNAVDALSAQILGQVPPPHKLNKDISIGFSWFVHRLLMKNPNNRYANWREVLLDIHLVSQGEAPAGIKTEEQYFSTISSKPLLDAMEGIEEKEEVATPSPKGQKVRVKSKGHHVAQFEEEHNREIRRSANQFAAFMIVLLLAWFVGFFWYRGVWQPELNRISKAMTLKQDVVLLPPAKVGVTKEHSSANGDGAKTEGAEGVTKPATVTPPVPRPPTPEPKPEVKPEPKPEVTPVVAPVEPPVQEPVEMPDSLRQALRTAAKAGDLSVLKKTFENDESKFIKREKMKIILQRAPAYSTLIAQAMESKKDQPISFLWRGKSRIVVPRAVTETSVTLEANGRRQEINFTDLTPDEMVSLSRKPHNDAEALSYCLLLMKSSRKSEISQYAFRCQPFQNILLEAQKE